AAFRDRYRIRLGLHPQPAGNQCVTAGTHPDKAINTVRAGGVGIDDFTPVVRQRDRDVAGRTILTGQPYHTGKFCRPRQYEIQRDRIVADDETACLWLVSVRSDNQHVATGSGSADQITAVVVPHGTTDLFPALVDQRERGTGNRRRGRPSNPPADRTLSHALRSLHRCAPDRSHAAVTVVGRLHPSSVRRCRRARTATAATCAPLTPPYLPSTRHATGAS